MEAGRGRERPFLDYTVCIFLFRCIRFDDKRIVSGAYDGYVESVSGMQCTALIVARVYMYIIVCMFI